MKIWRNVYKVARSVLFTAILTVVVLYLLAYVLLSVPPVQNRIKEIAEREASAFLGGKVEIGRLIIKPFNEVVLTGLEVSGPDGAKCLHVDKVGAGVALMKLITTGRIELTYAEIIGLDASVSQARKDGPLNIAFIIEAFKPKDKNKPPSHFDLNLRNVVLRRCSASFHRQWAPPSDDKLKIDFNHLQAYDIRADINLPRISNNDYIIDLRRLSLNLSGGLNLEKLAFQAHVTPTSASIENFILQLPATELRPSDITLNFEGFDKIVEALSRGTHHLVMMSNKVTPSDFAAFLPELRKFPETFQLTLEASGNIGELNLQRLSLESGRDFLLEASGELSGLPAIKGAAFTLDNLRLSLSAMMGRDLLSAVPTLSSQARTIIANCGAIEVSATGRGDVAKGDYETDCRVATDHGSLFVSGMLSAFRGSSGRVKAEVDAEGVNVAGILGKGDIGNVQASASFEGAFAGKEINGTLNADVASLVFRATDLGGIVIDATKEGNVVDAVLKVDNMVASADADVSLELAGEESRLNLNCAISHLEPAAMGMMSKYEGYSLSADIMASLVGDNVDNLFGDVRVDDFTFATDQGKGICLDRLSLTSHAVGDGRDITLRSDWLDGDISGRFKVAELAAEIRGMLAEALPSLVTAPAAGGGYSSDVDISLLLHADNTLPEFLGLPVRLLVPVVVDGAVSAAENSASLNIDIPYLQQGKNKLVRDSRLNVRLNGGEGTATLELASTFPAKNGEMSLNLDLWSKNDKILADIDWINPADSRFKGSLGLGAILSRNDLTSRPEVRLDIKPSTFDIAAAKWNIDPSSISYVDNVVEVNDLKIWHDSQFVEIQGVASSLPSDSISVNLAGIDLDYVFGTLKINYVNFGGIATGEITGKGVLSPQPVAGTDNLFVKDLAYNGAVLGDGNLKSSWDNDNKEVTIYADIRREGRRTALVDGGIWVTRDSLSFDIDADKVDVKFLKPFMAAFTSDVAGRASGKVKLAGTFSDIDLTGRVFADSIALKLDYTNVYYHGSDSVYLNPGHIIIPSFRLYDKFGRSAILSGELTHRYFHDPEFNFRVSDAQRLLCYDTNPRMNPDWYGTLYGDGGAVVRGWPGMVTVSVDMNVVGNSTFTFVLNDTQAAEDYHFLTFSDRRKEERERMMRDSVADITEVFRKKIEKNADAPSKFGIDIRATVTPSTKMTLVMDPVAGDKITARGNGAIQVDYESDSEEMQMFGKYILEEGSYNFSLQDLILRDFTIRPGSSISFNGDPLNADLNIAASYRVNTNLSDLDKSFSTDRDLARTNVPVDAILMVNGEMTHPDITFDIELPTLTQDVERKVKSIISTDDMMNRQIIYLLALNRFYTPEYMGGSNNSGGELAAVASTTISSQLSNMLGQLTDKFTVAPTFRSDKGDFSDLEVDVALSSRLLNNRLLVNGNFGYRDRSTSQTTFIGDFDIEYLLNRSGNLRLKAYNHFNDQNYYLREALTTQGLGVIYRRDFDNPFSFLKRKKKKVEATNSEKPDSVNNGD